jgi:hypothetical protein
MHALVYYVVKFVFVTLGLGSLVRGPDAHRDIHLDPISHPNAKEAALMDVDSSGRWSTVPAARKLVVSHLPLEERSSDVLRKYKAFTGYQRTEEVRVVANVFPFPISQQEFDDRRKINTYQESARGTAKLSWLGVLSLWLWVVGLMAHLWG